MDAKTKALVDACLALREQLQKWCGRYGFLLDEDAAILRRSAEALDAILGTPCEQIRQSK